MSAPKRPKTEKVSGVSPTGERPVSPPETVLQKRSKSPTPLESFEEPADRGSDDAKLMAKEQPAREDSI